MSFPSHDHYWTKTAEFISRHIEEGSKLIAPAEFEDLFPDRIIRWFAPCSENVRSQWAVIHKGKMNTIDYDFLKRIVNEMNPVFANEVFVVFSNRKDLKKIVSDSPHIISF